MRSRIAENILHLRSEIPQHVQLVAVSKTKPASMIQEAYDAGQIDFGENYVQELVEKHAQLPSDIKWHFIGPLQSNKVKYIAPFVHLIHGVASISALKEINKQGEKLNKKIAGLIQIHVTQEESKFGFSEQEMLEIISSIEKLKFVEIRGVMAMASFTDNENTVRAEFRKAKKIFDLLQNNLGTEQCNTLSMGMSGDWKIAVEEGSNLIRVGSSIFGTR